jgi:HEAT repeat protein
MSHDAQKSASHEPDERLALAERAAGGDWEALLAVVDRFPVSVRGHDEEETATRRALQRALIKLLAPCVPGLIRILEILPDKIAHPDDTTAEWSARAGYAAFVLGEIGSPAEAAVPALIRAMHADQRGVGPFAGPALGEIGGEEAIRELNGVWFSGWDRKLCEGVDWALEHLGARAHPTLLKIVREEDALARARALHSLRRTGMATSELVWLVADPMGRKQDPVVERVAVELLADGLRDPAENVRNWAARELGRMGGPAATERLLGAMPEDAGETEPAVAAALLHLLGVSEVEILTACLTSEETELSLNALSGLGSSSKSRSEAAGELATRAPADPETMREWRLLRPVRHQEGVLRDRESAMPFDGFMDPEFDGIGPVFSRQTVEGLIPYLRHANPVFRIWAAQALTRGKAEQAASALPIEPLKTALCDDESSVRGAAVRALGFLGGPSDLPAILPLLKDPDWDLRWDAVDALWRVGTSAAIAPLESVAEDDPDDEIRARAAAFAKALRTQRGRDEGM